MELDDLKQTWQQAPVNKPTNTDIMDLIHHKSYGPLAALKTAFRKQIMVMAIFPVLLFLSNLQNADKVLTSVLFWSYVAFCVGVVVFSYKNFRIVEKMEGMDGMVRSNLEQQIGLLDKRLQWHKVALRAVMVFFILLLEVVPYFQHYRMLDKWHALHPLVRFSSYAALLIWQYYISRMVCQRKFGNHIAYLKDLVRELQH